MSSTPHLALPLIAAAQAQKHVTHNEAIASLETAERIAPNLADYPYARGTILLQRGDRAGALAATRRALEIDPASEPARQLLRQLGN